MKMLLGAFNKEKVLSEYCVPRNFIDTFNGSPTSAPPSAECRVYCPGTTPGCSVRGRAEWSEKILESVRQAREVVQATSVDIRASN